MTTEKVEGADNSATETTPAPMDLAGFAKSMDAPAAEAPPAAVEAAPAEVDEWLAPPSSWKPELKANWTKYDKPLREQVYAREKDFHKGIEQYKAGHSAYEKFQKEVLAPYMPRIQASGLPQEQFVREFLHLDSVLSGGTSQQKQQALSAAAKYYGIDLSQFAQQPGQQSPQVQRDPTVTALEEKLHRLESTLNQSQTAAEQREKQEAMSEITAFKSDPKNIYFEDVKEHMAALLSSGKAKDMPDAYEQACYAHPNVRPALLKQQRETEEKTRIEETKRKTADAKRAGFEVQAQGAAQPGSKTLGLRDELAQRLGVSPST